jgi:Ca2+-transporting ATPase
MASQPLRCLAMAYKEGDSLGELNKLKNSDAAFSNPLLKDTNNFISIEKNLILVGFCGIKDPARPEVADSILKCRNAGIRIMMMTGDSKETAVAIAKDVNILESYDDLNTHAFTGPEFFSLPEETQVELLRSGNKVFCRTEPKHKQKLIVMLEKLGEITAMTGDGVNDAPALQQSNIGIAMGIAGTEVAKGAADMILADDNFATIVTAVEEGRNIYTNMQSFICYLISTNIGEVLVIFLATLLGFPEPLSPLHLLFVNLVTDGPPATALGFNPPDPEAMLKKPRSKNEPILTSWLLTRYIITGLYVAYATMGAFVWWYQNKGVSLFQLMNWGKCLNWTGFAPICKNPERPCDIFTEEKSSPQSMSLSVLVTMELLKALSAVSLDSSMISVPPWKNRWLLLGVIIPFACHLLILYTPSLANIFSLSPLSWKEWEIVLKFSTPILLVEEILKATGKYVSHKKKHQIPRQIF